MRNTGRTYNKPLTSRIELDKYLCEGCMDIQQIFSGSKNLPTGMNIKFNIQCGKGNYANIKDNLHAVVEIQGDGVSEYELQSGGKWATCTVKTWEGYNLCEYQLDGVGQCSYTSPLRVKRNGIWETVTIDWYGPQQDKRGNITWVKYTGN